eukprot:163633-Chlamydomonas_euryale.AAC.1
MKSDAGRRGSVSDKEGYGMIANALEKKGELPASLQEYYTVWQDAEARSYDASQHEAAVPQATDVEAA